jgi:hypothetical protein
MLKKIIIIVIGLILLAAGIVAYFFFFSPNKQDGNPDTGFSLQDLFPFGDDGITNNPGSGGETPDETTEPEIPNEPTVTPKLTMIAKGPIAGATTFDVTREKPRDPTKILIDGKPVPIETEIATKIRYTETSTGHTNETYLDFIDIEKITTVTIPKIVESYFAGKSATRAILRYAEGGDIETFTGAIPLIPTTTDGKPDTTFKGAYLPTNIISMNVSPDKEKIFTIEKNSDGAIGSISLPDGTKRNQVFSLAFSEWTSEWPNARYVTLTTKPSARVPGFTYTIDTTTKVMKKVLGNVLGLTTLTSPDMKTILFSRSAANTINANLYTVSSKSVVPLPGATTLPEKCVWQSSTILYCAVPSYIPAGEYPEAWYQGMVTFIDQIYKIDTVSFTSTVIANPSTFGASIDAVNLYVNPANTFLIFINKKDGSLWSLDLR